MNIIGITGRAGSGKDTVADILVKHHGFVRIGLADPMKRFLKEMFNFSDEQLWGPSEKRNAVDRRYRMPEDVADSYLSPRHALQPLGTEWGRRCYENIWIDKAIKDARSLLCDMEKPWRAPARGVVVPDIRFPNELNAIRAAGGRIWHRPGAGNLTGTAAQHVSELSLSSSLRELDVEIAWEDEVENLTAVVARLMEKT